MLAISLHQPWASLMAHGLKRVETRSWPLRHRGPLLIHAAKKWTEELGDVCESEPFLSALSEHYRDFVRDIPRGAIVGRVDVVACVPTENVGDLPAAEAGGDSVYKPASYHACPLLLSDRERAFGDYSPGRFAWLTAGAVAFPEPIPWRGSQGLFDVPDEVVAKALAPAPEAARG